MKSIDVPKILPEPVPDEGSDTAIAESQEIATGRLERRERVNKHSHMALLMIFWIIVIEIIVSLVVIVYHLNTPTSRHFLDSSQLSTLYGVLLTAIGSSAATKYSSRFFQE